MVKSNTYFSKNYKKSSQIEQNIKEKLIVENFDFIYFDIQSEFEKCNNNCPIQIEHYNEKIPYSRWILYNQTSRPDFLIKYKKPIYLEIKYKNKPFLWVNTRDYHDYIKWAQISLIPVYILMYVKKDNCYYIHKVLEDTKELRCFKTKHDKNQIYDLEEKSIKIKDIHSLIDFLKQKSM